ncbi:MAG: bacillithiol biosynthesis cysteine-adding enzyme BshC, partial [Bacteroidota bacterium]
MSHSHTRSIRVDYLQQAPELQAFYQYSPVQPDFSRILADKAQDHTNRQLLQQVIREQYAEAGIAASSKTEALIHSLGDEKTFTITTGHQLVLYAGPLFTAYKVMHVIKLAEHLRQNHPDHNFVPVFWIHTEDHDFEEVNHYFPSYSEKRSYPGTFVSQVGNHVLEDSIQNSWPEEAWSAHYQPGMSWKAAFRSLCMALFDEYGLVLLDADHPTLKAQFQEIIRRELSDHFSQEAIAAQSAQLEEAGYPAQITPREINLFYLDEQGRNRIIPSETGAGFEVMDRELSFTVAEMDKLVADHPERFSPNVSLRPLYQELILPNLAYVGGWGELSYWMQLKGVFEAAKVNFPLVLPRFSATLFTESQAKDWQALGFELADITQPLADLYRQYLPNLWDDGPLLDQVEQVQHAFEALHQLVETDISQTLAISVKALQAKVAKRLKIVHKKAGKVIRADHPAIFQKIEAQKLAIQPDGFVQERNLSLFSFPAYGPRHILSLLDQQI